MPPRTDNNITIGPYEFRWVTDRYRDPADGVDKERSCLWMSRDTDEGMGHNSPEHLQIKGKKLGD